MSNTQTKQEVSQRNPEKKRNILGVLLKEDPIFKATFYENLKQKCELYGLEFQNIYWSLKSTEMFRPSIHLMKGVIYESFKETYKPTN